MNLKGKRFENCRLGMEIYVYEVEGKEMFMGSEICKVLEHSNTTKALNDLVWDDEKCLKHIDFMEVDGGITNGYTPKKINSERAFITETGLYQLIFGSRLSTAREFQKWVFSEILPSIRKNNYYVDEKNIDVNQISKLENTVKRLVTEKAMLHEIVYDMADATTMSFTEASSKLFGKDAKYLKEMLIKHKFLSKDGNEVLKKEAEFITPSGKREVMRLFVHTNVEKCRKDEDIKYNKVTNFGYMYLKKHFNIRGLSDFSINKNEINIDEQLKLC
ncbi:MAG: BRO-N domain-containing protein [Cetobacterium sp.]